MQKILYGYEHIGDSLAELESRKCMLVCGHSFDCSIIKPYLETLDIEFVRFSDFRPNPLYEDVCRGVELFRNELCDTILAVGGGSAIDVAKCVKLYCKMPDGELYLNQEYGDSGIPLIAVPTTAGTGSESTRFAVIYYEGKKQSVMHPSIVPDYAILEPQLLEKLPLYQKKCTMMDALCQAIESWWSVNATDESRMMARNAIERIMAQWETYLGDTYYGGAAMRIMNAANMAGQAINISQTTAAHAFSYKITSMYGLPHGHAVAVCLPEIWEFMLPANLPVFEDISVAMGCGGDVREAIAKFRNMLRQMELGNPISANYDNDIETLAASVNPVRLKNNPVAISVDDARMIYRKIICR